MIFLGVDWAEAHHDACLLDEAGGVVATRRVSDSVEGVARLHEMVAEHCEDPGEVLVGIELDRGLLVGALVGAGYQVYAINPLSVNRYRDRHGTSGAKSDPGDAKLLADVVRTDRHNHRLIAGDTELADAVKVLARAHKDLIWGRQRHVNRLRNELREFYPQALVAFGTDLADRDAIAVLERASTPEQARNMRQAQIIAALRHAGRKRNLQRRAAEIAEALRSSQLEAPATLSRAYGAAVRATVAMIREMNKQISELEEELERAFRSHPDAEIYLSLPGLGDILGARVLGEFGDDPNPFGPATRITSSCIIVSSTCIPTPTEKASRP